MYRRVRPHYLSLWAMYGRVRRETGKRQTVKVRLGEESGPHYLSVAMYAARSPASVRDSSMSGIFGCGASRNSATLAASKDGIFAIVANGGA